MRILKTCALPLAALLGGCVGHNYTLFMTKSNAGMDVDMNPPTLDINISRKETVIAPSFEGGQTPPVMASFKPRAGKLRGLANYFLGVDQSFSGGDSAMAMAMLYDSTNAPTASPEDIKPYDSKVVLTKNPNGSRHNRKFSPSILFSQAEPGDVRPFVFTTDTVMGFQATWSGISGYVPDKLKVGFNRKEFAWAPLSVSSNLCSPGGFAARMPSFFATVQSRSEAATNSNEVSSLQYFATGNAATHLAIQPTARRAMLFRMDPRAGNDADKFGKKSGSGTADDLTQHARTRNEINDAYQTIDKQQQSAFLNWYNQTFAVNGERIAKISDLRLQNLEQSQLDTVLNKLTELRNASQRPQ